MNVQANEGTDERRHQRKGVENITGIRDALAVYDLKVGVIVGVPAAKWMSEQIQKTKRCGWSTHKMDRNMNP